MCVSLPCRSNASAQTDTDKNKKQNNNNTDSMSLERQRQGEYQWGQRRKSAGYQTLRSLLWMYHWMRSTGQSYLKGENAYTNARIQDNTQSRQKFT